MEICRAMANGDLGLAECTRRDTGEKAVLMVARYMSNNEVVLVPLAVMFTDDPYVTFTPPESDICGMCGSDTGKSFPGQTGTLCEECGSCLDEAGEYCMNQQCPNNPLGPAKED